MHTDFALFIQGLVIGFSIAAPVGPIGLLCIRRTLTFGQLSGLFSGLGAATADALYGSIVGLGLTFVAGFLLRQQSSLQLFGGLFLCYLGIKAFLSKPQNKAITAVNHNTLSSYGTTFFLTLTNPMTILFFAGVFAGLGMVNESIQYSSAVLMVMGVFIGSGAWWLILSSATSLLRNKVNERKLAWVNKISGMVILAFGVGAILSTVF